MKKLTNNKHPKNFYANTRRNIVLSTLLSDFQKFVYDIQHAEQRILHTGERLGVFPQKFQLRQIEKFQSYKNALEQFFYEFLGYNMSLIFEKSNLIPTMSDDTLDYPGFKFACMFSGGLDSGSYAMKRAMSNDKGILHHSNTNNRAFGKAKTLFNKYLANSNLEMIVTSYDNSVTNPMYLKTRGLLFLTNMLCISKQLQINRVIVPENGPFMINTPVSSSAEPTRTTNPHMICEWTNIFNKITNSNIIVDVPYITKTKSEVILQNKNASIISQTWSCSSYRGNKKMCGMCNSCLVRILSCYAINLPETMSRSYVTNPFNADVKYLSDSRRLSYQISIDAVRFWACMINEKFATCKTEKYRFARFKKMYPVLINHSVDMFLGFRYLSENKNYDQSLFKYFNKYLKLINPKILDDRNKELQKLKGN